MKTRVYLVALILGATGAASANPPQGVFTEVSPIAKRYPVTLITVGQGECDNGARALALVDATGATVMDPFVVPDKQKFVVTDVTWRAKPNWVHPDFGADESVMFNVNIYVAGGSTGRLITLFSEHQSAKFATGSMSYEEGPAFVQGTTFCTGANVEGFSNFGAMVDVARVHGYIQDDAPSL